MEPKRRVISHRRRPGKYDRTSISRAPVGANLAGDRFYLRFLRPSLALLIIAFGAAVVVTQISLGFLQEEVRQSSRLALEQTRDMVDLRIREIDSIATELSLDPQVNAFLLSPATPSNTSATFDLWAFSKSLPDLKLFNSLVDAYFVYSSRSNLIVTPGQVLFDVERDFERMFKFDELTLDAWKQSFLLSSHSHEFFPNAQLRTGQSFVKGFYYLQSLPIGSKTNPPLGQVMFFISDTALAYYLAKLNFGSDGVVMVMDSSGAILASQSASPDASREKLLSHRFTDQRGVEQNLPGYLVSHASSSFTGWTFWSVQKEDLVQQRVLWLRNLVLVLLLASIGLALAVAFFLARRSALPIEAAFLQLEVQQSALHAIVEAQRSAVRSELVRRLLLGSVSDPEEVAVLAKGAEMDFHGGPFGSVTIRIEGYAERLDLDVVRETNLVKAYIREYAGKATALSIYFYEADSMQLEGVAVSRAELESTFKATLSGFIEALVGSVREKFKLICLTAVAEPSASLDQIPSHHRESKRALDFAQEVYWDRPADEFVFALETELQLSSWIRSGNADGVRRVVKRIRDDNLTKIDATRNALATLASLISAVLTRHGLAKATAGFPHPTATSSMSDWFSKLEDHLVQVCASAQDERTTRTSERIQAINGYISANLSDRNFSMEMAADHFGMSPTSFYHFYRDNAKESFADRLERARIAEACKILGDGDLQIKQLISMVGFANDSTFRRAFRRVMGMSPHEYRPAQ